MKVLVACERSGRVRDAFIRRGCDAYSCDLYPSSVPGPHYRGDVRDIINDGWHLMIAHPPCTRLANSGVQWLRERDLWEDMEEAVEFFNLLLNAPIPRIAVENPIMHRYATAKLARPYDQIIQPWQFGHAETKATCLWLKDLPVLLPTKIVDGRDARIHKRMGGRIEQKLEKSITYQGIATAMAKQWGSL